MEASFVCSRCGEGDGLDSRTTPGLLINTGCLAIDLRKPGTERLYFHIRDAIKRTPAGHYIPWTQPRLGSR